MKKNRIEVFNRMTDHELADVSVFEDLLENHYRQFCFIYEVIAGSDFMDYVSDIYCKLYKRRMDVFITLEKSLDKKLKKMINLNVKNAAGSGHTLTVEEKDEWNLVLCVDNND